MTVGPGPDLNGGVSDAFVAKVSAAGTGLVYAGYIGGDGVDGGRGIAVDAAGNAYVTGATDSDRGHLPGDRRARPDLQRRRLGRLRGQGEARRHRPRLLPASSAAPAPTSATASRWTRPATPTSPGSRSSTEATFPVTVGPDLTYGGDDDAFVAKISGKPAPPRGACRRLAPREQSPGNALGLFDLTVSNLGLGTAKASTTPLLPLHRHCQERQRHSPAREPRGVPAWSPGFGAPGSATVTLPTNVALGSYRVLACVDDTKVIAENLDEANNCLARATPARGDAARPRGRRGERSAADGQGRHQVRRLRQLREHRDRGVPGIHHPLLLSKDNTKGAGDLLVGSRLVPVLNPLGQAGNLSSGSALVTIPPSAAAGTYRVLACADDVNAVKETIETNNCVGSPASVVVTPDRAAGPDRCGQRSAGAEARLATFSGRKAVWSTRGIRLYCIDRPTPTVQTEPARLRKERA